MLRNLIHIVASVCELSGGGFVVNEPRFITVRLWYPAVEHGNASECADYVPELIEPAQGHSFSPLNILFHSLFWKNLPCSLPWCSRLKKAKCPSCVNFGVKADQSTKFPLVIFSHGRELVPEYYTALCIEMASKGFIVAAPYHIGDHAQSYPGPGFYRILELRYTAIKLAKVANESAASGFCIQDHFSLVNGVPTDLFSALNVDSVLLCGHSLGSSTALRCVTGEWLQPSPPPRGADNKGGAWMQENLDTECNLPPLQGAVLLDYWQWVKDANLEFLRRQSHPPILLLKSDDTLWHAAFSNVLLENICGCVEVGSAHQNNGIVIVTVKDASHHTFTDLPYHVGKLLHVLPFPQRLLREVPELSDSPILLGPCSPTLQQLRLACSSKIASAFLQLCNNQHAGLWDCGWLKSYISCIKKVQIVTKGRSSNVNVVLL